MDYFDPVELKDLLGMSCTCGPAVGGGGGQSTEGGCVQMIKDNGLG